MNLHRNTGESFLLRMLQKALPAYCITLWISVMIYILGKLMKLFYYSYERQHNILLDKKVKKKAEWHFRMVSVNLEKPAKDS